MGFVNQKADVSKNAAPGSHKNWMNGTSFSISNPITKLRIAASSCFFGEPMYYHRDADDEAKRPVRRPGGSIDSRHLDSLRETLCAIDPQEWRGMSPASLMESAIDAALDYDPEATLQEAVRLRSEDDIRTTPQVILVRAANHPKVRGTGLIRQYASRIVQRGDEPAVCLAYHIEKYGKKAPIPNSLKRALRDKLESLDEYHLSKYKMEGRAVKTVDVVNLVHPSAKGRGNPINKLVKGELKSTKTWEAIISDKGSTKKAWEEALEVMGHMALLRNVRNLLEKGVDHSLFAKKLVEGAEKGRQLPFRYYSAYEAVKGIAPGPIMDAIEESLEKSLGNLPKFDGKVMSLCDNSGSACGTTTSSLGTVKINTIANLTGILTGKVADDGYVGIFGDRLEVVPVRKKESVFSQLSNLNRIGHGIGGNTENGIWLFLDKAIRDKEHWDHIFVYSDMQAGHGGLYGTNAHDYRDYIWGGSYGRNIDVAKLVAEYRKKVNPRVMVYLVQVAGYQDTIIPEFYDRTFILGGWSDGVLRFAASMRDLYEKPHIAAKQKATRLLQKVGRAVRAKGRRK